MSHNYGKISCDELLLNGAPISKVLQNAKYINDNYERIIGIDKKKNELLLHTTSSDNIHQMSIADLIGTSISQNTPDNFYLCYSENKMKWVSKRLIDDEYFNEGEPIQGDLITKGNIVNVSNICIKHSSIVLPPPTTKTTIKTTTSPPPTIQIVDNNKGLFIFCSASNDQLSITAKKIKAKSEKEFLVKTNSFMFGPNLKINGELTVAELVSPHITANSMLVCGDNHNNHNNSENRYIEICGKSGIVSAIDNKALASLNFKCSQLVINNDKNIPLKISDTVFEPNRRIINLGNASKENNACNYENLKNISLNLKESCEQYRAEKIQQINTSCTTGAKNDADIYIPHEMYICTEDDDYTNFKQLMKKAKVRYSTEHMVGILAVDIDAWMVGDFSDYDNKDQKGKENDIKIIKAKKEEWCVIEFEEKTYTNAILLEIDSICYSNTDKISYIEMLGSNDGKNWEFIYSKELEWPTTTINTTQYKRIEYECDNLYKFIKINFKIKGKMAIIRKLMLSCPVDLMFITDRLSILKPIKNIGSLECNSIVIDKPKKIHTSTYSETAEEQIHNFSTSASSYSDLSSRIFAKSPPGKTANNWTSATAYGANGYCGNFATACIDGSNEIKGEWIQIETVAQQYIKLEKIEIIYEDQKIYGGAVKDFCIVGSNDQKEWNVVYSCLSCHYSLGYFVDRIKTDEYYKTYRLIIVDVQKDTKTTVQQPAIIDNIVFEFAKVAGASIIMNYSRIANSAHPEHPHNAASKKYIDDQMSPLIKRIQELEKKYIK